MVTIESVLLILIANSFCKFASNICTGFIEFVRYFIFVRDKYSIGIKSSTFTLNRRQKRRKNDCWWIGLHTNAVWTFGDWVAWEWGD